MVHLALQLSLRFENVQSVSVPEDFEFFFSVQCTSCRETHGTQVNANRGDEFDIPGSKGTANLVMKCKFCAQNFEPKLIDYTIDFEGQFKTVASIECRNMEVTQWHLREGFVVTATSGTQFEDVDLSDDFADYDEKGNCPVGITEIQTKIKKA